jgi:uncharacterized protein
MSRTTRIIAAALFASVAASPSFARGEPLFLDGRWEGKVELRPVAVPGADDAAVEEATDSAPASEPFAFSLFSAGSETGSAQGGLVDMPSRGLFGFPMGEVLRDGDVLSFELRGKAPFDGFFELEGSLGSEGEDGGRSIVGAIRLLSSEGVDGRKELAEGSFSLSRFPASSRLLEYGIDYPIDTGKGVLPGSLLLPEDDSGKAPPLVLILAGAQADRDGNNYAVPGKSDSLLQLALSLRGRGVASLRFDKRGTGEAYGLVEDESKLVFDEHIEDAVAALRLLAADLRFSSLTVVGFAEGALVGACALSELPEAAFGPPVGGSADPRSRVPVAGLVALCASGRTEAEIVEEALESAPAELGDEAGAIMSALRSGGTYPEPSSYFADYFRPSVQPYLASLFARDIRAAFAATAGRCAAFVVAGGSDFQVALSETELLASSRPDAVYRIVPGMSHALKGVGDDEEANYASFTDPSLPLAEGLVELVAAFAKGSVEQSREPPVEDGESLATGTDSQGAESPDEGLSR